MRYRPQRNRFRRTSRHGRLVGDDATSTVHFVTPQQSTSNVDAGETIHTTANHPWLTTDRGWIEAGQLQVGEPVVTLHGSSGTVAWVHTVPGQADRYNLTVANAHTYAVGSGQWVVHNTGGPDCIGNQLPPYKGDKTTGKFVGPDGSTRTLLSGHSDPNINLQPRRLLPDLMPGMVRRFGSWNHVEAHAASLMRLESLQEGDLWINHPGGPCPGDLGCNVNLPHMLPEGATLQVHYPGGEGGAWVEQTYIGRPDDQWTPWRP